VGGRRLTPFGARAGAALVTGAASGIGRATVRALAARGVGGLVLIDRDAGGSKTLAHDVGGVAVLCLVPDVADEASWEASESAIRDCFDALSEAVVNAGVAGDERLMDMSLNTRHAPIISR
jgi:3-hydroxyacyl-CoA dehydrogenase/3-hydroxy-2-methylbutyryl-CoA dehydrogenase